MSTGKKLIHYWWPVNIDAPTMDLAGADDAKLKFGVRPQLVDLQPYILRWAFVWVVVSMLYSIERWLSEETVRLVFISVLVVLWLGSGAAFGVLLMLQKKRRDEAEEKRSASLDEDKKSPGA